MRRGVGHAADGRFDRGLHRTLGAISYRDVGDIGIAFAHDGGQAGLQDEILAGLDGSLAGAETADIDIGDGNDAKRRQAVVEGKADFSLALVVELHARLPVHPCIK